MTIEEIIAEIRYNQDYIRRSEEHIASRKVILKEFEDTLLSLGVQLVPPEVGEPLTIEELKSETWYLPSCTVEDYAAFTHLNIPVFTDSWEHPGPHTGCSFQCGDVTRNADHNLEVVRRPKIRRIGNQFYWESDLK